MDARGTRYRNIWYSVVWAGWFHRIIFRDSGLLQLKGHGAKSRVQGGRHNPGVC